MISGEISDYEGTVDEAVELFSKCDPDARAVVIRELCVEGELTESNIREGFEMLQMFVGLGDSCAYMVASIKESES